MSAAGESDGDVLAQKRKLRRRAEAARLGLGDAAQRSAAICERLLRLPEYAAAHTLMLYLNMPHEVHTEGIRGAAQREGKRLAAPYVAGHELHLFEFFGDDELTPGVWGIREPSAALRRQPARAIDPAEIDLVIAPGVAFDRRGGRLGHGKGYYDRFLQRARASATIVGVAFECQLFDAVPMAAHDAFMDYVITERGVYDGRAARRAH